MEETASKNLFSGYAAFLAEQHVIDKQIAFNALQHASINKISYIEYLINNKILDESQVARTTSEYFGLPLCDIKALNLDLIPIEYLNIQLVRKRHALPVFKKHNLLYLAITDPTIEYLNEVRFLTRLDTRLLIVESSKLIKVIDDIMNKRILSEIGGIHEEQVTSNAIDSYDNDSTDISDYDVDSAPVVNYLNRVLIDAIEKGASDIHFEHYEDKYRIRFRQHGILYPITSPPLRLANYLLARIKVMSDMDITEHRIPQDGRFKLIISRKRSADFRVSVCPTLFGEKIVLRILNAATTIQGVEGLGMDASQHENLMNALQRSQGMILVTGPTGSGKTVTLYASLNYLNSPDVNISTVEDPVEIPIFGINQVHVNVKTGMTFSTALRSFLRQDPDIIMVGEIRDLETAEIAVKAAQTGHLVLSTLHTNSAPETITRLMNMGIEPYNLASSLKIIIAQRLVRVLCDLCKIKEVIPRDILLKEGFLISELDDLTIYAAVGCQHCVHGFKGRIGIFEVLPVSEKMEELILQGTNVANIVNQAKTDGIMSLRESGLKKVKEGITSLAELNRVFK